MNIKLSVQLSLYQQGAQDQDALIGRARTWLQSAALDSILHQHGLRVGAGSPAHLVTLMSSPGGTGALQGVDEVIMTSPEVQDGSGPAATAATAAASADSQHPPQAELSQQGQKHYSSTAGYSKSGMSAWGRLQPHELKPIVLGHHDADVLAQAQQAAHSGSGPADHGREDEVAKRTVLGAVIGAVLGSAALGAAAVLAGAGLLRRRRAVQVQAQGCNTCKEQGGARNEQVRKPDTCWRQQPQQQQ